MQRHSSNQSEIKIPPILLKNFNAYDILEPLKNGANNSDATKVDKLIDIDDCSRDSGFLDSDLHPAFLDKNRDFDLVDLYQNIFVTPQQIKTKENDATDESDANPTVVDAGFKQFFDIIESGQKVDWANIAQPEEKAITIHDFIEKKPRVLVPKVFTEPDSDPEDLIHEVLIQKTLEKLRLDSISSSPKIKVDEPPERESPNKINEKHNHVPGIAQSAKKSEIISEFSRSSCINCVSKDAFAIGSYEKVSRPSETYSDSQLKKSSTNFTVKAIQKDEKVYKKKRILKPESQTANYTKGPDFDEKSVVLPQIMSRLHAQLAYLDEKSNQKRRYILDAGANPVKSGCSSANVNAQVKKPNNQASSSVINVKQQVKTKPLDQPASSKLTKNVLTTKVQNNASSSGIYSQKMNNVHLKDEARLCTNKLNKDIRVHTTDKPCMNCGNPSTSIKTPEVSSTKGKLSPEVLMEDCNKERLKALKQSQMFKDFVLTGKLPFEG